MPTCTMLCYYSCNSPTTITNIGSISSHVCSSDWRRRSTSTITCSACMSLASITTCTSAGPTFGFLRAHRRPTPFIWAVIPFAGRARIYNFTIEMYMLIQVKLNVIKIFWYYSIYLSRVTYLIFPVQTSLREKMAWLVVFLSLFGPTFFSNTEGFTLAKIEYFYSIYHFWKRSIKIILNVFICFFGFDLFTNIYTISLQHFRIINA